MNYLYLLVSEDRSMFKIGVSRSPILRAKILPDAIKYEESKEVEIDHGGDAYAVERMLHYLFRDHRLSRERGDGRTEWFSIDAFDQVASYLSMNASMLGIGGMSPLRGVVTNRAINQERRLAAKAAKEEMARQAAEARSIRLEQKALECAKNNAENAKNISSLIATLLDERVPAYLDHGRPWCDAFHEQWFLRIKSERGCEIGGFLRESGWIDAPFGGLCFLGCSCVIGGDDFTIEVSDFVFDPNFRDNPVLEFAEDAMIEISDAIRRIDFAPGAEDRARERLARERRESTRICLMLST